MTSPRLTVPLPSPAAVTAAVALSIEDVSVGHKQVALGAEDEDVIGREGQDEEDHFELKPHLQEHSTCNEGQDAAVHGVLGRDRQYRHVCVCDGDKGEIYDTSRTKNIQHSLLTGRENRSSSSCRLLESFV